MDPYEYSTTQIAKLNRLYIFVLLFTRTFQIERSSLSFKSTQFNLPPVGLPPLRPWRTNQSTLDLDSTLRSAESLNALMHPTQNKPTSPSKGNRSLATLSIQDTASRVVAEQSETCTPEQNKKQIQCLRELPADRYEVLEGEDVQMRCRVSHQRGKTQWRAGNFLLGYLRSIPNWPRYSIQGDARLGIHDLVIQNVTKADAGPFECQVSPVDGQPPLRRQTTLSILIKPSQPTVVAATGEPQPLPNGQLIVPRQTVNSSSAEHLGNYLRLSCESRGGIPPPTFEWFHNGVPIKTGAVKGMAPAENELSVQNQNKTVSAETHSATLILHRDSLNTGDRLVCLVSNKATLRSKLLSQQKLRSELIVVIHSAPGDPELIDWTKQSEKGAIFANGTSFEATCRAFPAGNPPGELSWRWERPKLNFPESTFPIGHTDIAIQPVISIPPEYVVHQYSEDKLLSKIHIPRLSAEHHGLDLVCAVKHQVGPEKLNRLPILVKHGPESVYIHGPEETTSKLKNLFNFKFNLTGNKKKRTERLNRIAYVYQDRPQYMLCFTGPYYDQVSIQWYGLSNRSGEWQEIDALDTFSSSTGNVSRNFRLGSIIQLVSTNTPKLSLEWTGIKCKARQVQGTYAVEDQTILRLYEPPGKPVVNGYEPGALYYEGTSLRLHCEATTGTPAGHLLWSTSRERLTDDKTSVINSTTHENSQTKLRSSFEIKLNRANNGLSVWCVSVNDGYNISELQTSEPVRLNVAYASTTINLTVTDESGKVVLPRDGIQRIPKTVSDNPFLFTNSSAKLVTADSNAVISIICQVELSNPRPTIQWRWYNCPVTTNGTRNYSLEKSTIRKHCAIIPLKGEEDSMQQNNIIQSSISLSLNWSHHGDYIECFTQPVTAYQSNLDHKPSDTKTEFSSIGSKTGLNEYVILSVRFKPVFVRPSEHMQTTPEEVILDDESFPTPQYIAVEGGTVELDLTPLANPPVHKLVWYKDGQPLKSTPSSSPGDETNIQQTRMFIEDARLHISPVEVNDMADYAIMAVNTIGSTRFKFFLNVTFGPQLIGKPIINITATGKKAQLECEARANPTPTENAVSWRRISHSLAGMDYLSQLHRRGVTTEDSLKQEHESLADSVTGIKCNKGKWHNGFKYFAKCWSKSPGTLTSLLTIYDLGPSDVGRYQCHMDNAIGSPAVRIVDLIYPFAPRVISIPRWSKSAPGPVTSLSEAEKLYNSEKQNPTSTADSRQRARLKCVIAAEPKPEVTWSREPANLTLVEGGQFRSEVKMVHPGLYHATLYLSQPRDSDLGRYFCKATNLVGEDIGRVELIQPTKPDMPQVPRLINATSSTLAVTWTQGFNGGPEQKFQLRWSSNEHPDAYNQAELEEESESETITYVISGLQKATTYRIAVSASNDVFGSSRFTQYLLASTRAYDPAPDKEAMHDEARTKSRIGVSGGHWEIKDSRGNKDGGAGAVQSGLVGQTREDKAMLVIVTASIFGALVLIANLLIILLLAHRKRKNSNQRQKSSVTVFPGNDLMQLCPSGLSFADMHSDPRHMYTAYGEGASLSEDVLVQSRSADQFPQFHASLSPTVVSGRINDNFNLPNGHQSFTGSPHPSLQAHNLLSNHTQNHFDFGGQLSNNFTDPELNALSYMNSDMSPTITDIQGNPLFSVNGTGSDMVRNEQYGQVPERRTPISIRVNGGLGAYPNIGAQRIESPNSGAASSISAAQSGGYPNTNSLERNPYFHPSRLTANHPQSATMLVRQASFGQYNPPGAFNRIHTPYASHQTGLKSTMSSFTPTQTLRTRTNPSMAVSFYAERGMSPLHNDYSGNTGQNELMPTMGTCQLVRRGSYNSQKSQNVSSRMNTSELLDTYLQRYNEQLEAVRAMARTRSPSKHGSELDGTQRSENKYDVDQGANRKSDHSGQTDTLIIPPPNAFGGMTQQYAANAFQNGKTTQRMEPPTRPVYRGSDEEEEIEAQNPPTGLELHSNALVKHPTPDHVLRYTMDNQNNYSRFTSIL